MPQDSEPATGAGVSACTARKTALRHAVLDLLISIRSAPPQERPALRGELAAVVAELRTFYP